MLRTYGKTYVELSSAIVTVMAVLALAYVMNLSGQTGSLGSWLAGAAAPSRSCRRSSAGSASR